MSEAPQESSATALLNAACAELNYVRGKYEDMTDINQDRKKSDGIYFISWEKNAPPARSLWESLPNSFVRSTDVRSTEHDYADLCRRDIDHAINPLRMELIRVLTLLSSNRPPNLEAARSILRHVHETLTQVRQCVNVLMQATVECSSSVAPKLWANHLDEGGLNSAYEMGIRMPGKQGFGYERIRLYAKQPQQADMRFSVGRVVRLKHSNVSQNIVAYYLATVNREGPITAFIDDISGYALTLPEHYRGHGIMDVAAADMLNQFFDNPKNINLCTPAHYPTITCRVETEE